MSQLKRKTRPSQSRLRRSEAFKQEALALAQQVGVAKAAKDLGVYDSQIYQWRAKAAALANRSDQESALLTENARYKREIAQLREEVAILKKASAYFA